MDESRIRSGTRVKFKKVREEDIPKGFVTKLQELAHWDEHVQALYLFAIEVRGEKEELCMALSVKSGLFKKPDEEFKRLAGEIQLLLPEDMPVKFFRLEDHAQMALFCLEELEPIYLRSSQWREKLIKKLRKAAG